MKVLYTLKDIMDRTRELAKDITVDYHGRDLMILSVLNGAFVFTSDLVRMISKSNLTVDFVRVKSYQGLVSTGQLQIEGLDFTLVKGKHVLVVEDIVDTGQTCNELWRRINVAMPASLQFCTLLDKPGRRIIPFTPKYCGFQIPNLFVIGYGLDYNGKYRNLPEIYTFEEGVK